MVVMQNKIRKNWHPPKELKTVVVKYQILSNGFISGLRIDKSSGDPANDKVAIEGVANSVPFDPLPDGVDILPIEYGFEQVIRSGMHQIPVSERNDAIILANAAIDIVNQKDKDLDAAVDKLDFAFEKDPKNHQISSVLRAVSAYVNDETPDKVRILHRVLALDPQQHAAIEKLRIFLKAEGKDPDSVSQRIAMGEQLLEKMDAEGALAEFTQTNMIKPGSCPQDKMVEAYRILVGHRMARKWQTIAKLRKDDECLCGLGRSYQLAGEYGKAESYYKEALAVNPASDMAKSLMKKLEEEKATGIKEKVDTAHGPAIMSVRQSKSGRRLVAERIREHGLN